MAGDDAGKAALRKWPTRTQLWSKPGSGVYWLRAQPKETGKKATGPRLVAPGSKLFKTQPDGLWITFGNDDETAGGARFADCVAVEVCGTMQNLWDKRWRFASRTSSSVLDVPKKWLKETVKTVGFAGPIRSRADLLGVEPVPVEVPVRYLRVLYTLPAARFPNAASELLLEGHEYLASQASLKVYHGQPMQRFLKGMAPHLHVRA